MRSFLEVSGVYSPSNQVLIENKISPSLPPLVLHLLPSPNSGPEPGFSAEFESNKLQVCNDSNYQRNQRREKTMENNNDMSTEPSPSQQLTELIQALEQAAQMAKQLPTSNSNPDLIFSSLHSAQLSLSSFLSLHPHNNHPSDNSVCSAGAGPDETMIDGEEEQNSKDSTMERVEEKMRDLLYIQNKRPKRPLSPSSAVIAERRGLEEREGIRVRVPAEYDPQGTMLRSLDLVYQFHG